MNTCITKSEMQQVADVGAYSSYTCAHVTVGLLLLTCGIVTIGAPLVWTAGVTRALPGGSNHFQVDNLTGFAQMGSGQMLQFHGSSAAPEPGT